MEVSVAVEESGPATTAIKIRIMTTVAILDRLSVLRRATISSERPRLLIMLLAANTNSRSPPVLEKCGISSSTNCVLSGISF